jgi:glycosyltransferase involved in cell wall biosynthesis
MISASRPTTAAQRLIVGCVATCAPRQCGIATFSADLARAMGGADPSVEVRFAAIDNGEPLGYADHVHWRVTQGDPDSYRCLAEDMNDAGVDVVLLQHEFGLFGTWGPVFDDHLTGFLDRLHAPVVAILHSVPPTPSPSVRAAVTRLARRSTSLIVIGQAPRRLLIDEYGVDRGLVRVVLHGVPSPSPVPRPQLRRSLGVAGRQLISTFGFLDPHKGLEHMIAAMSEVVARFPRALYAIVGRTHPELARHAGESYRHTLERDVVSRGLGDNVVFVNGFVTVGQIVDYLAASDVYVTPYLDMDQVTSGTLAYALGQGRAVVSTPYTHAREALAHGRGVLVPPADPAALADAVVGLLRDPLHRGAMERRAAAYGAVMTWPIVGAQTLAILRSAIGAGQGAVAPVAREADRGPSRFGRRLGTGIAAGAG